MGRWLAAFIEEVAGGRTLPDRLLCYAALLAAAWAGVWLYLQLAD